jgi:UDP-glucose 4-epimerase
MAYERIAVVTGGAGFIGSHMVDLLLNEGYRVHIVDDLSSGSLENISHHKKNSKCYFENIDICHLPRDHSFFKNAEYVFHFAGKGDIVPSIELPSQYMEVNVQGTVKVLEAARYAKIKKLVYAASSSCYGKANTPTDETAFIDPQYPYALSKYIGEQVCFHWHKVYRLPLNSIRIFNAYGVRSRTSGSYGAVMGVFLKQKLEGRPYTVVGDGSQSRDFVYVTDVAKAFYLAAKSEFEGQIYNLGAGNPQSISKLVKILQGEVVNIPKRPAEPDITWANISKISNHLDWRPEVSFEEGISKMLKEQGYWEKAPLWDPKSISEATQSWFEFLEAKC